MLRPVPILRPQKFRHDRGFGRSIPPFQLFVISEIVVGNASPLRVLLLPYRASPRNRVCTITLASYRDI
jgi:hypothetical protein